MLTRNKLNSIESKISEVGRKNFMTIINLGRNYRELR